MNKLTNRTPPSTSIAVKANGSTSAEAPPPPTTIRTTITAPLTTIGD